MNRIMTKHLWLIIHCGRAINNLTGLPQADIAFGVNTIKFVHRRLKQLVPITVITNIGQDKYLVDDLNMVWGTVGVRLALSYDPLNSNPYVEYLRNGFWEQLFKNMCSHPPPSLVKPPSWYWLAKVRAPPPTPHPLLVLALDLPDNR